MGHSLETDRPPEVSSPGEAHWLPAPLSIDACARRNRPLPAGADESLRTAQRCPLAPYCRSGPGYGAERQWRVFAGWRRGPWLTRPAARHRATQVWTESFPRNRECTNLREVWKPTPSGVPRPDV